MNNYLTVTRRDNSVQAKLISKEEWFNILEDIFKTCGKLIEESFRKYKGHWEKMGPIEDFIFNFRLPKETGGGKRFASPELEKNTKYCGVSVLDSRRVGVFGEKISSENLGREGVFFEKWLLVTTKAELLLVETFFYRQDREKKDLAGYDEVVTEAFIYGGTANRFDSKFREKLTPLLNASLVEKIIRHSLDVLNLDRPRREREAKEFEDAYGFYDMVCRRINF